MFFNKKQGYLTIFLSENKVIISFIADPKDKEPLEVFKHDVEDTLELGAIIEKDLEAIKETHKITPKESIFFLSSFFIDSNSQKIKAQFVDEFKILLENLELKPLGYIETQEAIGKYEEKGKIAVVEIDSTQTTGHILENSELLTSINKKFSENKLNDIKELLKDLKISGEENKIIFVFFQPFPSLKEEIEKLDLANFLPIEKVPEIEVIDMDKANELLISIFLSEINKDKTQEEPKNPEQPPQKKISRPSSKPTETLPLGFMENETIQEQPQDSPIDFEIETEKKESKPKFKLPKVSFKLPQINLPKRGLVLSLIFFFLLTGTITAHELYYHKLVIKIVPEAKMINIEKSLSGNSLKSQIEYEEEEKEVQESISTTGEKTIGEKASGVITIYNFSGEKLNLKAGTKIAIKGKTFLTKTEVTLDPASEETISGTVVRKPTQKDVEIEAEDIGEDYNLSTEEKIPIGGADIDLYYAKIKKAPSGGKSEKLKTVAKADLENLRKKAIEQAKSNLKTSESSDKIYLPEFSEVKIKQEKFDKEIGEVADKLKLQATLTIKNPFITKEKLLKLAQDEIQNQISTGWEYLTEKSNLSLEKLEDENYNLKINLYIVKKLDLTDIPDKIKFKSIETAKRMIAAREGVKEVIIESHRSLIPFTPLKKENITLE